MHEELKNTTNEKLKIDSTLCKLQVNVTCDSLCKAEKERFLDTCECESKHVDEENIENEVIDNEQLRKELMARLVLHENELLNDMKIRDNTLKKIKWYMKHERRNVLFMKKMAKETQEIKRLEHESFKLNLMMDNYEDLHNHVKFFEKVQKYNGVSENQVQSCMNLYCVNWRLPYKVLAPRK